ncbi:MAG: cytochrome c [Deltaproteobacteria bacterium]|jgi:mono/diheme cytochrome c family protein|nr:cytochrome c [Deltaproteobacteria bacterium]
MKKNLVIALGALTIFFGVYSALTVYDTYFKFGRMWQTPAVRPYETPLLVMDDDAVPVHGGESVYRATDPLQLHSPLDARDPEIIKQGQVVYATYCQQCHGINHDGQGTVGQSFAPLPTDLRSPRVQQTVDGLMFKEISFGVDRPDARQPALATTIFPEDRWKVVHYVKSLGIR